MSRPVSEQTRRNRQAAGRKAAAAVKANRARIMAEMAPDGPLRGSAPLTFSIADTLARLRAGHAKGG